MWEGISATGKGAGKAVSPQRSAPPPAGGATGILPEEAPRLKGPQDPVLGGGVSGRGRTIK